MLTSKAFLLFVVAVVLLTVSQWLAGRRGLLLKTPAEIRATITGPIPPVALTLRRMAYVLLGLAAFFAFH